MSRQQTTAPRPAKAQAELTLEELEAESATELPQREELSLIIGNAAVPLSAAAAPAVLPDSSTAVADAPEETPVTQATP